MCLTPGPAELQAQLMSPPNATWREIITQAASQPEILKQPEVVRNVQNILATNVSVASSLGHPFLSQIQLIYIDMLNLYKCGCACVVMRLACMYWVAHGCDCKMHCVLV